MVKLFRLHKISGLLAGGVLFVLAVTGFFLDHDTWRFLYTTTLSHVPKHLLTGESRLFEGYLVDPADPAHRIACGKRGIFESRDGGRRYKRVLAAQCNGIRAEGSALYAATDDGIYQKKGGAWRPLALRGRYVNALAAHDGKLLAAVEKRRLFLVDADSGAVRLEGEAHLDPSDLKRPIRLSRFVRDLHYGRGLFDGEASLLINDYGALALAWLAFGGYLLWWLIHRKKAGRKARLFIKAHANLLTVAAAVPLVILAVTGIFLDHAKALGGFMRSVTIPSVLLPPVYGTLRSDIWSVDYDGTRFRIGNRYGVFASADMRKWKPENPGFAYRMFRRSETLYVSGMGAPNRILEGGKWRILPHTPHMFKDVVASDGKLRFFSTHRPEVPLPRFDDITLYTLMLSLHDGSFFAPWWVWINDIAALLLLLLLGTGTLRWWVKRRKSGR